MQNVRINCSILLTSYKDKFTIQLSMFKNRNRGRKGKNTSMENMYELPSREDVTECIITKDVITGEGEPKLLAAGKEVPALEEKQEEPEKKESESA